MRREGSQRQPFLNFASLVIDPRNLFVKVVVKRDLMRRIEQSQGTSKIPAAGEQQGL
jgi:hypothetical protein